MADFYKKNEDGEFVKVDQDKDEDLKALWKKKSDNIVRERMRGVKETAKKEVEEEMLANIPESVTKAARAEVEKEFQKKLDDANSEKNKLDVALRRKTIAAEYGFKPELEDFLGDGDDEDMRSKADALKGGFSSGSKMGALDKETSSKNTSSVQERTGIKVEI